MNRITNIILNSVYEEVILYIKNDLNIEVRNMSTNMKSIFEKSLNNSGKTNEELIAILQNSTEQFKKYIKNHFSSSFDEEQEYDEGEELIEEERDSTVKLNTTSSGVIVNFLIQFSFLKEKDYNSFEKYLKKQRVPGIKKHIKELQEIYEKSIG